MLKRLILKQINYVVGFRLLLLVFHRLLMDSNDVTKCCSTITCRIYIYKNEISQSADVPDFIN